MCGKSFGDITAIEVTHMVAFGGPYKKDTARGTPVPGYRTFIGIVTAEALERLLKPWTDLSH